MPRSVSNTLNLNLVILLAAELSGSGPPGTVWLLTDQSTVEFTSDSFNSLAGFRASFRAANTTGLSGKNQAGSEPHPTVRTGQGQNRLISGSRPRETQLQLRRWNVFLEAAAGR